ncbi:DUF433 domain-containing protein [Roseimicrobium sp. ORNL1]|uniref:DUF433 domain-containing protein n=1 Tax=Roseimicrobium sp. ORNL1 TaxID=2711231 RepID=UPI0013E2028A|nr:DUF433 domain-containing protein [Roseimicrobium sp. ORNL1]QIF05867.1 DUF433 domain-containing protein [Roseimicrobium sp. ORNL1]
MSTALLEEASQILPKLSRAEKALVLQWLVTDLGDAFPGIEQEPGICGGSARLARTRVPVWTLEAARRQGMSESEILRAFPALRAEDLSQAWAYVRSHQEEIDKDITENEV